MRWKRTSILICAALSAFGFSIASAAEPKAEPKLEPAERFVLDNGLEVILQPDHSRPSAALVVDYHVGRRDDPPGLGGLAHLVGHLACHGSRHLPSLVGTTWLHDWSAGSTSSPAFILRAHTVFNARVPASQIERVLWVESERMAFTLGAMKAEDVALERAIVAHEEALWLTPNRVIDRFIRSTVYPAGHPDHDDPLHDKSIESIELPQAQWLFQRAYRPDNATLVVVGDFDVDSIKGMIAKYFGTIVNPPLPRLARKPAPLMRFEGQARMHVRAELTTPRVQVLWPLPDNLPSRGAELRVLTRVLSARLRERLMQVDRSATAVRVDLWWADPAEGLTLELDLASEADRVRVSEAIEQEITRLQSELLKPGTFSATRQASEWLSWVDSESLLARAMALTLDRDPDRPLELRDPADVRAHLASLTAEDLRAAAQRYLPRERRLLIDVYRGGTSKLAMRDRTDGALTWPAALPGARAQP